MADTPDLEEYKRVVLQHVQKWLAEKLQAKGKDASPVCWVAATSSLGSHPVGVSPAV